MLTEYSTLNITKIVLCNVLKGSQYNLNTDAWEESSKASTNFTLYDGDAITLASDSYIVLNGTATTGDTDPYLFFIPQELTAWNESSVDSDAPSGGSYLQITCTITNKKNQVSNYTAYYPFAATLQKGYQYNVNINIGKKHLYKIVNSTVKKIIN